MISGKSIFYLKRYHLGKLVAAAITCVVTIFSLSFGLVGASMLRRESKKIETQHDTVKSEYWVRQIAEAAFLGNWAYIEGNIKPGIEEQPDLAVFYVANGTNKIIISSNPQFLDRDRDVVKQFIDNRVPIFRLQKIIREGSNLSVEIAGEELELNQPLQRDHVSNFVSKSNPLLWITFNVRGESGAICTIAFGYDLGPMLKSLNRAQSIILVSALITAMLLGLATFLITARLLRPLEEISGRLAGFSKKPQGFDESLGQFDLSGISANSLEVGNLLRAFSAFKDELKRNIAEMADLRTTAAIAQTTQMLAHDLRKPFGLLKISLLHLSRAKDPESVQRTLKKVIPEIDRASNEVQAMLGDLLEIGTKSESIMRVSTRVLSTLEMATYDAFLHFPKADISISYDLQHTTNMDADTLRIQRVFSNILHNSIQAMKQRGRMWIRTRNVENAKKMEFIEFTLGNSGPIIPEASVAHLFEMFFTQNKAGGTGLGLAIVRKIILAHGGEIRCVSAQGSTAEDRATEFIFTVPAGPEADLVTSTDLPLHSSLFQNNIKAVLAQGDSWEALDDVPTAADSLIEAELATLIQDLGRPLQVALVDDEPVYNSHLEALVQRSRDLNPLIVLQLFGAPDEALDKMKSQPFDLTISDIDYGHLEKDGYSFVREIRSLKGINQPFICMHSNRISSADQRRSMHIGADSFLPKPMPKSHMLKLLLQAARHANSQREA